MNKPLPTIAFCYPTPFNPVRGGVERVTCLLAKEFVRRGHRVHFLNNYGQELAIRHDFEVYSAFFPSNDYADPKNIRWYYNYLRDNEIDIVINQCGQFGDSRLYCNTGGIAKVISVAHMSPEINLDCLFGEISALRTNGGFIEKIKRIVRIAIFPYIHHQTTKRLATHYDWIANNTDCFVMLSQRFEPSLRRFYQGEINWRAIANPLTFPIANCNDQKENIVVWVGRMDNQKRPDLMVKIWQRLAPKDWNLVMIGGGKMLERIKRMTKDTDNITLTGFTDPFPYYQKAKILCMTSGHEGFGMVLTEAMSRGAVPIAFESFASVRDIITDDRQLVPWKNLNEYCQKLDDLMHNTSLQQALREKGYLNADKFQIGFIVDQWEDLFNSIVK